MRFSWGINVSFCGLFSYSLHISHAVMISLIPADMPGQYRHSRALHKHEPIPRWEEWIWRFISRLMHCGITMRSPLNTIPYCTDSLSRTEKYAFACSGRFLLSSSQPLRIICFSICRVSSLSVAARISSILSSRWCSCYWFLQYAFKRFMVAAYRHMSAICVVMELL